LKIETILASPCLHHQNTIVMRIAKSTRYFCFFLFATIISATSCQEDESEIDFSRIKPVSDELFLKEYQQGGEKFYSFAYTPDKRLEGVTFYGTRTIEYKVVYNDTTRVPQFMESFFRNQYMLKMELQYAQARLEKYRFTVNGEEAFRVDLFYDSLNRVVRTFETSEQGLLPISREFDWIGGNVHKVRIYPADNNPDFVPSEYVYEYDNMRNPFATVYKSLGYNVPEGFPLCESNWTVLRGYKLGDSHPVFTVRNKFTYYGLDYPYERVAEGESKISGKEDPVYSVFVY